MAPINGASVKELAKRSSPLKNRLSFKDIKNHRKKYPPGWYLRSILLDGNMELIYITLGDLINDAHYQPLIIAITNDSDPSIEGLNILGCFRLHRSLSDDSQLIGKSGYARKVFVRLLDDNETTPESRKAGLQVIKAFLERPENNKYDTNVYIPSSWDITPPPPASLRKVDYYLKYEETVKIIRLLFAGVDHHWASDNPISANAFFTAGYIPYQASTDLGFPEDKVVPIGVTPPFPLPQPAVDDKEKENSAEPTEEKKNEEKGEEITLTQGNCKEEEVVEESDVIVKQEGNGDDDIDDFIEKDKENFNEDETEEYDPNEDHLQQDSEGENSLEADDTDVENDECEKKPPVRALRSKSKK